MKRLYALLVIMIVIYIGVNLSLGSYGINSTYSSDNDVEEPAAASIVVGASSFDKLDNFT